MPAIRAVLHFLDECEKSTAPWFRHSAIKLLPVLVPFKRVMTITRFNHLAAFLFGLLAIYTAAHAALNVLSLQRSLGRDLSLFSAILFTASVGLALLWPHRLIPLLRRIAAYIGAGQLGFLCGVALVICAFVAVLSRAVPLWVCLPVAISFTLAFVMPGFSFRDIKDAPSEQMSTLELGELIGERVRNGPQVSGYLFIAASVFVILNMLVGCIGMLLGVQSIPTPSHMSVSIWIAALCGIAAPATTLRPFFQWMVEEKRYSGMPSFLLMAAIVIGMSIYLTRINLVQVLPVVASYFSGQDAVAHFSVVKVDYGSTKFCRGSVFVETAYGVEEICHVSSDFLRLLSPGDGVTVVGKETRLGLTVDGLWLPN